MSKMRCKCDHVMSDTEIPNPFEGSIVNDETMENIVDSIGVELAKLMEAKDKDARHDWMTKHFNTKSSKNNDQEKELYYDYKNDNELISDYIYSTIISVTRNVWECDNCNRLWIQTTPSKNQYESFNPDIQRKGTPLLTPETE